MQDTRKRPTKIAAPGGPNTVPTHRYKDCTGQRAVLFDDMLDDIRTYGKMRLGMS